MCGQPLGTLTYVGVPYSLFYPLYSNPWISSSRPSLRHMKQIYVINPLALLGTLCSPTPPLTPNLFWGAPMILSVSRLERLPTLLSEQFQPISHLLNYRMLSMLASKLPFSNLNRMQVLPRAPRPCHSLFQWDILTLFSAHMLKNLCINVSPTHPLSPNMAGLSTINGFTVHVTTFLARAALGQKKKD